MRHKVSDLNQLIAMLRLQLRILEKSKTKIGENENGFLSGKLVYVRLNFSKIARKGCLLCFLTEFQEAVY